MAKKRIQVKPRFYVFIGIIVLVVILLVRFCAAPRTQVVTRGSLAGAISARGVVVRDEAVQYSNTFGAVSYAVAEGATVQSGEVVASIYAEGYSAMIMTDLQAVRAQIVEYQKASVIGDLVNRTLQELDARIEVLAGQIRDVSRGGGAVSLLALETELAELLTQRQAHIRSISPDDPVLNRLYDKESSHLNGLMGWQTTVRAASDGRISFYMDGGENWLTPGMLDMLTVAQLKNVLDGKLDSPYRQTEVLGKQALYRVVSQDSWYVVLLTQAKEWSSPVGSTCQVQFDSYTDALYPAVVRKVSAEGSDLVVQLQIQAPLEGMMNARAVTVSVGSEAAGYLVPLSALHYQSDGTVGVYVAYAGSAEYVQVTVLGRNARQASVAPAQSGKLTEGMKVRLSGGGG